MQNPKEVAPVYKTTDYEMFKHLPGNRPLDRLNIARLKKTFAEKQDEIKNLSKNAKMVNSFLNRNMNIPKIAEVMFSTETFVRNIIKKYNLPK